jgi:hypothetical protein
MRTVRSDDGRRYLLVKQSSGSSLVRDPQTGAERYVENDRLETVEGESPLAAAAGAVAPPVRRVVTAVHDDRSLGLLVEVVDRGPTPVRELLGAYDLCESDLHGLLAEFRAAGLVAETSVAGERGYEATETAQRAVGALREAGRGTD